MTKAIVQHGAPVDGGFVPEVRRIPDVVTRPRVGTWEITVTQATHSSAAGYGPNRSSWATDAVVQLDLLRFGKKPITIALLPGEALQIARALTRGADLL